MKPNRTRSACSRRRFLKSAAFGAGALGLSGLVGGTASPAFAAPRRRKKPNVLFILIDDQMPGEMGAYGGDAPTPHMDSIATDGVKFTRGYTSSPTCTPTRYTCLTGEYASRTEHPFFIEQCPPGAMSVVTWNTNLVPERCMAQAFKGSGYTTGMVGKWHVSGHGKPGLAPIARGADPHTPFMARWTGTIPAGQVSDALAGNVDVAPTVFDVCDITPPRSWTLDGKSMIPLVTKKTGRLHDALFLEMGYTRAVVTGRYKYIALRYPDDVKRQIERHDKPRFHMLTNRGLQKRVMKQHPAYEDFDQLYDLKTDPDEKHNLAADPAHAETLKSMKERMAGFLKTFPKRPFGELTG